MSTQSCSFTTVCILSDQALQCCTIRAGKTGNRRCCLLPCFDIDNVEQAMRPTMAAIAAKVDAKISSPAPPPTDPGGAYIHTYTCPCSAQVHKGQALLMGRDLMQSAPRRSAPRSNASSKQRVVLHTCAVSYRRRAVADAAGVDAEAAAAAAVHLPVAALAGQAHRRCQAAQATALALSCKRTPLSVN
jgi:hypothetical protein